MANRERAHNALRATRALGIPDEEVKPVLKDLFKLFDRNWEMIEAESYRALIDAYFELKGNKEKHIMKDGVPERPSKKPHLQEQDDEVSSTVDKQDHIVALEEERAIGKATFGPRITDSSQPCSASRVNSRIDSGASMPSTRCLNPNSKSASDRLCSKQPCTGSGSSDRQEENVSNTTHNRELMKGALESSLAGNRLALARSLDASGSNSMSQCDFFIGSSTLGEVKIALNYESAARRQNFQVPDFREVVKDLKDEYLRIHKVILPDFSVMRLLKDLCECYLKKGTDFIGSSSSGMRKICNIHRSQEPENAASRGGICDVALRKKALTSFDVLKGRRTLGEKRYLRDITKGTENVKISLIDEIGKEDLPKFTYIPQNIVYQNAYLHISLARIADSDCCSNCSGDCLSCLITCACVHETGGDFAYTRQGLLKEEFLTASISKPQENRLVFCQECPLERFKNEYIVEKCKGHLIRKFIKECWRKCGCDMKCGNRVVQRGITCNLQVFMTREGKGWGLQTLECLPKGTFVCEYVGEILTNTELYERNMQDIGSSRHTYPVTLDADWGSEKFLKDEEALCLDATFSGNVARFINHRCGDANLIDIPVQVETPDRHYYHLAFFTTREVSALEELNWDYGIDFNDHNHPIKAFKCCCGSPYCRDE